LLFSGQHHLQQAYGQAAQLGFWILFLLALILMARLFPLQYVGISIVAVGMMMVGQWLWKKAMERIQPITKKSLGSE
jgi:drug/metabolite transporter (DMT)-like permease